MKNFMYSPKECPFHKGEYLEIKNLIIKTPDEPNGIGEPFFNYCKRSDKFSYNGKLLSKEEMALEVVNKRYKKNYKLSDIEAIMFDGLVQK